MMDILNESNAYVLKIEKLRDQLNEINEFLLSIKVPALNNKKEIMKDVEIGVPTVTKPPFCPGSDGHLQHNRWHKIRLEDDLGITDIQNEIKSLVTLSLLRRKEVIEIELKQLIGGTNNDK